MILSAFLPVSPTPPQPTEVPLDACVVSLNPPTDPGPPPPTPHSSLHRQSVAAYPNLVSEAPPPSRTPPRFPDPALSHRGLSLTLHTSGVLQVLVSTHWALRPWFSQGTKEQVRAAGRCTSLHVSRRSNSVCLPLVRPPATSFLYSDHLHGGAPVVFKMKLCQFSVTKVT